MNSQNRIHIIMERVIKWLAMSAAIGVYACVVYFTSGCAHNGAQVVEGMDVVVGITVPGTDGVLQLDALNYLSGFRMGIAKNASMRVRYTCATTNSFFGVVHSEAYKTIDAEVSPCVVEQSEESNHQ